MSIICYICYSLGRVCTKKTSKFIRHFRGLCLQLQNEARVYFAHIVYTMTIVWQRNSSVNVLNLIFPLNYFLPLLKMFLGRPNNEFNSSEFRLLTPMLLLLLFGRMSRFSLSSIMGSEIACLDLEYWVNADTRKGSFRTQSAMALTI